MLQQNCKYCSLVSRQYVDLSFTMLQQNRIHSHVPILRDNTYVPISLMSWHI
uniref:Uncharacterized protein n=1 Tax=Arundo donax TaxID=35708 RepID=A0A0A9GLP2_ARUDO